MANSVGFEGANDILRAPPGDTDCRDLEMLRLESGIVSCWRLTEDELKRVNETGVVWLHIAGRTHPPVYIAGDDFVTYNDGKGNSRPARAEPYVPKKTKGGEIEKHKGDSDAG